MPVKLRKEMAELNGLEPSSAWLTTKCLTSRPQFQHETREWPTRRGGEDLFPRPRVALSRVLVLLVRVERFELITKLILSQPPLPIGLHAR